MYNFNYEIFQSFRDMISIEKIRNFHSECINYQKENHIKEKTTKINKQTFMAVFKKIFSLDKNYIDIYELFFKRFKNKKCMFKTEKNKENYILYDIISTDEIDIYNIEIALIVFYKCDFFKKIKMIFELTDIDNDGLINEFEIKKMIFTINNLFPRDVSQYKSDSNLISQSLSNIYAKEIYRSIMYNPGGLGEIIHKEKYINFEIFYEGLIKLHNYKYNFLPLYVNIMDCLLEEKKEIEYNMNNSILNDFISVSNELICQTNLKYNENEQKMNIKNIINENTSNKKIIEPKLEPKLKNIENENKKKQIKFIRLSGLKNSSSMTNLDIDNCIKNKINRLSRYNKYKQNKCLSQLYSTSISSLYYSKNQKQNQTTIQIPKNLKIKKFSLNNIKNIKKINLQNNSYEKTSKLNKKKTIYNSNNFNIRTKKNNDEFLNCSSSNKNHHTESLKTFNEKKNHNSTKLITQKINYDKLVNLQFPPCKIISIKNSLYFPKFSYKKKNQNYFTPSKSDYLLKTRNEINDDINKVIGEKIISQKENDSINTLMIKINIQKNNILKKVGKGKHFSPNFFKFKYQPIYDSIII